MDAPSTSLPSSAAEMDFLFQKVNGAIFDGNECLAEEYLKICIEEANTLNMQLALTVSATIKRILTLYRQFNRTIQLDLSNKVMEYIFKKWDTSVDVICYESCDSFGLLLDIHSSKCQNCREKGFCSFQYNLVQNITSNQSTCRSIFKCMGLLSKTYPHLELVDDNFVKKLYNHIGSPSLVVVVSDLICTNLSCTNCNKELHLSLLETKLKVSKSVRSAILDKLIPNLIKHGHSRIVAELLAKLGRREFQDSARELETVLSLVSMLIKDGGGKVWSNFVDKNVFSKAILHSSSQVRLTAWNLLCIHPRLSTPYTKEDLFLMKIYLLTSAAEQSPAIRQKILAAFKQVLIRIAETAEAIIKKGRDEGQLVQKYDEFLCGVVEQAFASLDKDKRGNFNRRVFSLSIIDYIYRQKYLLSTAKTTFWNQSKLHSLLTGSNYERILSCLGDTFQLCQIMSFDLLLSLEDFKFEGKSLERGLKDLLNYSKDTIKSIRSHDATTAGYRFKFYNYLKPEELTNLFMDFVTNIESSLKKTKDNLMAITESPIHPTLGVLVALLPKEIPSNKSDSWRSFMQERLIPVCYRIAELVTQVVHSMAPEGYIPEEELQALAGKSLTQLHADISQRLLVCCWRSHKHISEIFDWAVRTLYPSILSAEDVHKIGEYFWLQLTECRHCGAFESAVDGFTYLCSFLWKEGPKDKKLPKPIDWLKRILKSLEGGEDLDNLCSTRRSAGVPHLVVAILSTEPGTEALALAAGSLLDLDSRELKYRIHCLNVLKAIIHTSSLKEKVSFLLEECCRIAVAGCSAQSWSERNSSAQLAAALRTHIFGVTRSTQRDLHVDTKNRQSAHEFFSRFPSLYSFLYHQLENVRDEFSAYPTLIFMTHLYPTNTVSQFHLAPFVPLLLKTLLWCKAEKLRKLCAVATVAICQKEDIEAILSWLKASELDGLQQNHLNAALLLMEAISVTKPEFNIELQEILKKVPANCCNFNLNLLQEVNNQVIGRDLSNFASVAKIQQEILDNKRIDLLKDADKFTRVEIYSWLGEEGLFEISDPDELLSLVLKDFEKFTLDSDRLLAKMVLDRYFSSSLKDSNLMEILTKEPRKTKKLEMEAVNWSLLVKLTEEIREDELIAWAKSTIDLEDDYPKEKAIELCVERYSKVGNVNYLKILVEMLQDENVEIRELTTSLLSSSIFKKSFPLNPEISRYLLLKLIPDEEELFSRQFLIEEETLFDPCSPNVFAEPMLFGDFSVIDKLL